MYTVKIAALSLMLATGTVAADDCSAPATPDLPKGDTSTMEQMIAGQKAVKAFQADNIEYMKCLETGISDAEKASKKGADEDAKQQHKDQLEAYNAAVSAEETVADDFNAQIRAYKAANPS